MCTRGKRRLKIKMIRQTFQISYPAFVTASIPQCTASAQDVKQQALQAFREERYAKAIKLLQQARAEPPHDAEFYYYLGYFTHSLCYDSIPLSGFGGEKSDEVLAYLRKAIELDPHHGNARYFLGAEYGARGLDEIRGGRAHGAIEQYRPGREHGGYPDWLLEYAHNTLRSCAPGAILFVGGHADFVPIAYVQTVEQYRQDVPVTPVGLLDRLWFVLLLKTGLTAILPPAPVSWTREQILELPPFIDGGRT